jgi:hypothetical protein
MRRQNAKIALGQHNLNINADGSNIAGGAANPPATMRKAEIWYLSQTGHVHDRSVTCPLDDRNGLLMMALKDSAQQHTASQKLHPALPPFEAVETAEFAFSQFCQPGSSDRLVQVSDI